MFADRLEHLCISRQLHLCGEAPGLRERTRIGKGDFHLEVAEVHTPIAFSHAQLLRMREPIAAHPRLVVVSVAVHDERVAFPASD